jgi:hypothetical protein
MRPRAVFIPFLVPWHVITKYGGLRRVRRQVRFMASIVTQTEDFSIFSREGSTAKYKEKHFLIRHVIESQLVVQGTPSSIIKSKLAIILDLQNYAVLQIRRIPHYHCHASLSSLESCPAVTEVILFYPPLIFQVNEYQRH